MPTAPTYPGVYIEEVPSGVRTITGVATSITAFVGFAPRGPMNAPTTIQSFADYVRIFGGLSAISTMSYAVQHYFLNGGRDAIIIRTGRLTGAAATRAAKSTFSVGSGSGTFALEAANEGVWGDSLRVRIDHDVDPSLPAAFNLSVKDLATGETEVHRNLSVSSADASFAQRVLETRSKLLRATAIPTTRPDPSGAPAPNVDPFTDATSITLANGANGQMADTDLVPALGATTGIYALDRADLFNLLCIPPVARDGTLSVAARQQASAYCEDERALFVVDPDAAWDEPSDVTGGLTAFTTGMVRKNSALYFPRVRMADSELGNTLETFPPCGVVAGVMARTDAERGVWKAPAGQETSLTGVQELAPKLTDGENGLLNPLGVNCLRTFPVIGNVVWGARTLDGADSLASEWKYVPVRRLALFLEESLYRGTQWVVFEPNDEALWAQIRLNVGAFMQNLFRQGAFQGATPRDAYFVKCDNETTTQNDINLGIVNILVGFAPLKPAEFVIIRIQQIAGQIAT
jgi:Bacteriophage tail sheath protein